MARIRKAGAFKRFGGSSRKSVKNRGSAKRFNNRRSFRRDDNGERWLYFGSALLSFGDEVQVNEAASGNRYVKYQVMYSGNDDQEHTATGVIFENMENQIALAARAFGYEVEDFDGLLQVIEESGNEEVPVVVSVKIRDDGYYNVWLCNPDSVNNGSNKRQRRSSIRKLARSDDADDDQDSEGDSEAPESKPSKVVIRKLNRPIPQEPANTADDDSGEGETQI